MRYLSGFILIIVLHTSFNSCKSPVNLLKNDVQIDTLHIILDTRPVYPASFKDSIVQKMKKFVRVYNAEVHPFKLAMHQEPASLPASITIKFNKIRFITKKQSMLATGITAAGIGTATYLIATGFAVPFGWIYIPTAKCSISPEFSTGMSDIIRHQKIMLSTSGMFKPQHKQESILSKKLVKYVVEMILDLESQYNIKRE
ncbi:MAG: hypothetical protein ACK5BV_09700 [Bacteroidota bacterium]